MLEMIRADFICRKINPLQNKGRPAWDYKNAADIMRLRHGLNYNFTVIEHTHHCQRLFQLKVDETGEAEMSDKAAKIGKVDKPFQLPAW